MTLTAVGHHTEKPTFVKYKRHGHFRAFFLGGLQTHGLSNWAAQCRPVLPPPKLLGLFQNEFISGSTNSRLTSVRQYYFKLNLCPTLLHRDEVLSSRTTSQWTFVLQYYFKMILFPAVILQDEIMCGHTIQDKLISDSTTSGWTYVQQLCRKKQSFNQLHNCLPLTTDERKSEFCTVERNFQCSEIPLKTDNYARSALFSNVLQYLEEHPIAENFPGVK